MSNEKINMNLQELLNLSDEHNNKKVGLSEERLKEQLSNIRNLIAFFREYPDIFIDFLIKNYNDSCYDDKDKCPFKFYFYQRIFLRVVMRHRYVYATFPRA